MNRFDPSHRPVRPKPPQQEDNKALLKKVNRVSRGRRKVGMDGVKIAAIMVGLMVAVAVMLIFIGNLEMPQTGTGQRGDDGYNGETLPPYIVSDPFAGLPVGGVVLPPIDDDMLFYPDTGGSLELPLIGATGWAAAQIIMRDTPGTGGEQIAELAPGRVFTILDRQGDWWYVRLTDETTGWVDQRRSFINLPDVLPSIVYSISNASAAIFTSSGFDLPGITGAQLYSAHAFNYRLGRYEYIVPGMYLLARALFQVQQLALSNNDTLVIYEVFRPRATQHAIVDAMNQLGRANALVYDAIADSPWSLTWFVSTGISNHQRGGAVDATLARIRETEIVRSGDYSFLRITDYNRIETGTRMHELSPASAIVSSPRSISAGQILGGNVDLTGAALTGGILRMQWYFANQGFDPLASEWWHFNHQPSIAMATASGIVGEFYTPEIHSEPPPLHAE